MGRTPAYSRIPCICGPPYSCSPCFDPLRIVLYFVFRTPPYSTHPRLAVLLETLALDCSGFPKGYGLYGVQ
eukprot:4106973-Prymnesium_polylepis.1